MDSVTFSAGIQNRGSQMKINNFELERFFAKYEFSSPYLLCCSDCETMSIAELLAFGEDYSEEMAGLRLGYTESKGHPALRDAVSDMYIKTTADDVLAFSGAEEGIFVLMNALLERDDHIIVQFPAYQSLFEVAQAIGCDVTRWTLDEERGWRPDLDLLRDSIRPETKLIVINFPHNPTGSLATHGEYLDIIEIASDRGIHLLSDEVYRLSEYSPADRLGAMCDLYDKGISLGVMSKSLGLAGLRIGWLATRDREAMRKLAAYKDYTTICNSAPSELLATFALKHSERILQRNLGIIQKNLDLLDRFFAEHEDGFEWIRPKAGPIAFPRLREGSVKEFSRDLLEKAGVLLLPSKVFDYGDSHFRIGFGRADMPEALEKLSEAV